MGEITTLALNAPKKASLRTTIPMFIVKQWGLKAGDRLDWSLEARKNEMVIVVRKTESNSNQEN
jgi:bifunctional DNA-binding transcriptional regulator/antitoxin component of YhaV-PrlF toxin-antitoxin module